MENESWRILVTDSVQSTSSSLTYREDRITLQTVSLVTGAVSYMAVGIGSL